MLSCIATISVNGALRTKLRAIADAGFEYVEIFESDLLASPEPVHVIGAMMRDLGLSCVAFQPFRDFEGMPAAKRGRVFDRAERKFDLLQELGTDLMLVSSNVSPTRLAIVAVWPGLRREGTLQHHDFGPAGGRFAVPPLIWGCSILRSVSCSTRSTRWHPEFPSTVCVRSAPTSSSMCSLPTLPSSRWIRCPGAAIFAACPGRANCHSSNMSAR